MELVAITGKLILPRPLPLGDAQALENNAVIDPWYPEKFVMSLVLPADLIWTEADAGARMACVSPGGNSYITGDSTTLFWLRGQLVYFERSIAAA